MALLAVNLTMDIKYRTFLLDIGHGPLGINNLTIEHSTFVLDKTDTSIMSFA